MQRGYGGCSRLERQSIPIPHTFAFGVKAANFAPYSLISNPSYNIVVINFQENHKKLVIS